MEAEMTGIVRQVMNDPRFLDQTKEVEVTEAEKYETLMQTIDGSIAAEAECGIAAHRAEAFDLVESDDLEARCRFLVRSMDEDAVAWHSMPPDQRVSRRGLRLV